MLGDNLCITVLTGRRLALLHRTLEALDRCDPAILDGAHVVVYLNGHDPETCDYVNDLPYVDRFEYNPAQVPEPIGNAVSRLATMVPRSCAYHMHMEDDWTCQDKNSRFLGDASLILETQPKVGQVRMRLTSERVLDYHMITQKKSAWERRSVHGLDFDVANLHYTFNPTLVRTADLTKFYPADHELTAARNYMKHFPLVAQLHGGVFKHIGDEGQSLRAKLGRA